MNKIYSWLTRFQWNWSLQLSFEHKLHALANRFMRFAHEDYEIHASDAAVTLSIINICEISILYVLEDTCSTYFPLNGTSLFKFSITSPRHCSSDLSWSPKKPNSCREKGTISALWIESVQLAACKGAYIFSCACLEKVLKLNLVSSF